MAKTSGIVNRLYVNQYDLSGDVGSVDTLQATTNQQDITTLDKKAIARLGLLRDGQLAYTGFFDPDAGHIHAVVSTLPQNALDTWCSGVALAAVTGSLVANQSDYTVTRAQDGSLVITTTADANATGIEWGNLLTFTASPADAAQTFASATNGSSIDDIFGPYGDTTSGKGLSAYLHAISIGSGSATVHIQDSANNSSFSDVTGGVFTAVSAAGAQRIATTSTQSVRRYLRVNVTGTFTNLRCVVAVSRNVNGIA